MRLMALLLDHPLGKTSRIYALAALMSLHCARLPARIDASGNLTPWSEQDRSKWNLELVGEGMLLLEEASRGGEVTEYHLEALIALAHASAASVEQTNWDTILYLYDLLLKKAPNPIVELNRSIALGRRFDPERALEAISLISEQQRLLSYPFYFATLGELEMQRGRPAVASAHFVRATALARNLPSAAFSNRGCTICFLSLSWSK
jgi:predicted RNA polymerase sigma factor